MSEDDTYPGRQTRPHSESIKIARELRALLTAEDTGAYKQEVLLQLQEHGLKLEHIDDKIDAHVRDDSKKFESRDAKLERHEALLNRIQGALLFIVGAGALAVAVLKYFGEK